MALEGNLAEFSLPDIIQLVDLSKKTGAVWMRGERSQQELEGWLYFRDGKIIGARCGQLAPLDAAYTFFTFSSGPFRFHDNVFLEAPTITQSNEFIIMEGIMRQEEWQQVQSQIPSLTMVPRLVPNPASTGGEISLEADEWRVLTMVNGRNTIGQIAQRSGFGELRTSAIIGRLLSSGLIEKRELFVPEELFSEIERIIVSRLGNAARGLLEEAYTQASVSETNDVTQEQITTALASFEAAAHRAFGAGRTQPVMNEVHAAVKTALSDA